MPLNNVRLLDIADTVNEQLGEFVRSPKLNNALIIGTDSPAEQFQKEEGSLPESLTKGISQFLEDPINRSTISQILNQKPQPDLPIPRENLSTGNQIGRQAVRGVSSLLGFPLPSVKQSVESTAGLESPLSTFVNSASETLPLGFGEELEAGANTLGDIFSGNLVDKPDQNYLLDILDQYRNNRNLERLQLDTQSARNPLASTAGAIAGTAPLFSLPFGKLSFGKQVGSSVGLGGAFGAGLTEEDVIQNPLGVLSDAFSGASISGAIAGIGGGGLKIIQKLTQPKALDAIAAHSRVAGGGNPRLSPKMSIPREAELPPSVKGFLRAEKQGLIRRDGAFVSNSDSVRPPASKFLTSPKEAGKQFANRAAERGKQIVTRESQIDYDKLRKQLGDTLVKGREEKLKLLEPIKNKAIPLEEALGENPSSVGLRTARAIKQIKQDAVISPIDGDEVQSLRALQNTLSKDKLTLGELDDISRNLGITTKRFIGKQLPEGSPQKALIDTKIRIDNKLSQELDAYKPGLGKQFREKNIELFETGSFLDAVKKGHETFINLHGKSSEFEQGLISRVLLDPSGAGSPRTLSIAEMLGGVARFGEKGINMAAKAGQALTRPPASLWITRVLSSYDVEDKTVKTNQDIELYNHFVDLSDLSPKEKAKLKSMANTKGKINLRVIPRNLKKQAQNQIDQEL